MFFKGSASSPSHLRPMFNTAEGQVAQHPSGAGPEAQNHS